MIFLSCSKDPVIYTLTVTANPAEGGTVSPSSQQYDSGDVVSITATPSSEYVFQSWSGSASGSSPSTTVTMDSDKAVVANFIKKQYPLTIEIEGDGTVTETVIKQGLATDYNSGTIVELTAEPTGDWEFVEWTGDITSLENPTQITIDGPKTVKVKFKREYNYLTSWDIIKNYNKIVINFSDLGYEPYQYCGYDTTTAAADFNMDGYIDFLIAPQCSDSQIERQPPVKIYLNDGKNNFSESSIEIENNIGPLSGTRTTIVGDYNGDAIPDVFFVSHDGHEGPLGSHPGGFPSILLSQGEKFVYRDINLKRCWYNDASSADIDLDGDLDIVYGGGCHGLLINDGYGNFTNVEKFINNYNPGQNEGGAGVISLIDMNNDKYPDLLFRTYWYSYLVFSENGIFDFKNSIKIPPPTAPGKDSEMDPVQDGIQILETQDRLVFDIDNDGDYDIITASLPANGDNPPNLGRGYYFQLVENKNSEFIDITSSAFEQRHEPRYVEWQRINDYDGDGYLELYENQHKSNWWIRRWDGSRFKKIN